MTSEEFSKWEAYYKNEPFGPDQQDLRFAHLLCLIANAFGRGKKLKPGDIFKSLEQGPQTVKNMRAIFMAAFAGKQDPK